MSFIHSCFISYKCSDEELTKKFILELSEALDIWTGQYLDGQKSYYDVAGLKAGYKFDETLSKALVTSTCMIAVLSPRYFRSDYCYREYLGMLWIEARRRATTGRPPIEKSLIIPLLVHGNANDIPKELKEHIHYMALPYRMSNLVLALKHDPNLIPIIEDLGQLIYEHYRAHDSESARLAVECCADFVFPACPAAGPWPQHKPKPQAFVGRVV